jgi:antitoxin component YwqK of YwqJK toxin-antitoxin module
VKSHLSYSSIFLSILLCACSSPESLEFVEKKDDFGYTLKFHRKPASGALQGWLNKYDTANRLIESAHYDNDTLHGLRILYFDNGDTMSLETYNRGSFEGLFRAWHENGKIEIEGTYADNAMAGIWKAFYENGRLKETVTFANGAENGPFVEYFEDGTLKAEGTYRDGDNEHGLLRVYDESGQLLRTMMCDMGVCKTIQSGNTD